MARDLRQILRAAGLDPDELLDATRDPVKAYKLFRQKDEELYPLFVNNDKPVPMGEWLSAESGALTDRGQVKSSIGPLAYRPGWHAGDSPRATHIGGKAKERGRTPSKPNYRPDSQVWAEVEMPGQVDWQSVADSRAQMTKSGKPLARTAHITDQVPYGGHYRYKTNPNMDGSWLIGGDMKVNRVLEDAEVRDLNRQTGGADLPRLRNLQRRKGYVPAAAAGAVGLGALADTEEAEAAPLDDGTAWMEDYKPELMMGGEGALGLLPQSAQDVIGAGMPQSVQAGILGAGQEWDKLTEGGKDLFDWLAGNEESRDQRRIEQAGNDRAFKQVEEDHPLAVFAGSVVPYVASGGAYGAATKAATRAKRVAGTAAIGAGEGALRYNDDPWARAGHAGLGALFAVGGPAAAKGIKNYFNPDIPDWAGF